MTRLDESARHLPVTSHGCGSPHHPDSGSGSGSAVRTPGPGRSRARAGKRAASPQVLPAAAQVHPLRAGTRGHRALPSSATPPGSPQRAPLAARLPAPRPCSTQPPRPFLLCVGSRMPSIHVTRPNSAATSSEKPSVERPHPRGAGLITAPSTCLASFGPTVLCWRLLCALRLSGSRHSACLLMLPPSPSPTTHPPPLSFSNAQSESSAEVENPHRSTQGP